MDTVFLIPSFNIDKKIGDDDSPARMNFIYLLLGFALLQPANAAEEHSRRDILRGGVAAGASVTLPAPAIAAPAVVVDTVAVQALAEYQNYFLSARLHQLANYFGGLHVGRSRASDPKPADLAPKMSELEETLSREFNASRVVVAQAVDYVYFPERFVKDAFEADRWNGKQIFSDRFRERYLELFSNVSKTAAANLRAKTDVEEMNRSPFDPGYHLMTALQLHTNHSMQPLKFDLISFRLDYVPRLSHLPDGEIIQMLAEAYLGKLSELQLAGARFQTLEPSALKEDTLRHAKMLRTMLEQDLYDLPARYLQFKEWYQKDVLRQLAPSSNAPTVTEVAAPTENTWYLNSAQWMSRIVETSHRLGVNASTLARVTGALEDVCNLELKVEDPERSATVTDSGTSAFSKEQRKSFALDN
jgi:hypothetical protein